MLLVFERKDKPGTMEVAWTWMPFFIAADNELIKDVDRKMSEMFKGSTPEKNTLKVMHAWVIRIVTDKYRIPGLKEYLYAIEKVKPDGEEKDEGEEAVQEGHT